MDIIVVSHQRGRTWRWSLDARHPLGWMPVALALLMISSMAFATGYLSRGQGQVVPEKLVRSYAKEAGEQRAEIEKVRDSAREQSQALSRRLAELQAHVMRIDAVGQRLTQMAGLDQGEFDFNVSPAVGGPETAEAETTLVGLGDTIDTLDRFEKRLSDRQRQLRVLEDLLLASRLQKEVSPSGWPVTTGYISSPYGVRTDPFTGKNSMHPGIDFAGREGSPVLAVATGIVQSVGVRSGYGNMVVINHGNGYVTRYGHNEKIVVKVGDRVVRGQQIALMGSTGRSTGPHVHFEVLLNGRIVDPSRYIQAAR